MTIELNNCCEKCYLIDCCCEADRLQVIADDERARQNGYIKLENGDWIRKKVKKSKKVKNDDLMIHGIICKNCNVELPPMLMSEHLDINSLKNKMCACY